MKLGIGLPTWTGNLIEPDALLAWARAADAVGFHAVAVHDKPNHDTWDPLATLAAIAPVTERVRLVTAALLLPPRDEALVAKQAAVIDRLSGGRVDLGVAVGGRADDFELLGRTMAGRGDRFASQLERLHELWAAAQATAESGAAMGPAPAQQPHPRLWVGGYVPAAIERAVRFGDGFLFGAPGVEMMRERIPVIREAAAAAGREPLPVAGLAYVLPSEDPAEVAEGERLLLRYYGSLRKPFREMVATGSGRLIAETAHAYEAAGVDVLHLVPVMTSVKAVERLADEVLPEFER